MQVMVTFFDILAWLYPFLSVVIAMSLLYRVFIFCFGVTRRSRIDSLKPSDVEFLKSLGPPSVGKTPPIVLGESKPAPLLLLEDLAGGKVGDVVSLEIPIEWRDPDDAIVKLKDDEKRKSKGVE